MLRVYDCKTEYLLTPNAVDTNAPRFSWKLQSDAKGVYQKNYRILAITDDVVIWDSGVVESRQSQHISYKGSPLLSRQKVHWKVTVTCTDETETEMTAASDESTFQMGLLAESDWIGKWIEPEVDANKNKRKPAPYLRRIFQVKRGLKKARVYQTAHGLYESYFNGNCPTEDKFKPGLTSYYYRIQYQTYDITSLLKEGENVWAVVLADGWWRGVTGGTVKNNFGYKLHYLGQIELFYEDGSTEIIGTDENFKTATGGLLASDMLMGDIFDASLEPEDWKRAGFDDSAWKSVHLTQEYIDAKKIASRSVPVREKEIFTAKVFHDKKGRRVLDFGQNIAGYVSMKLHNTKQGQMVTLTHGETLDHAGNFTIANVDKTSIPVETFQQIKYICKGDSLEIYKPDFSVFGFRYVLLEGYEEEMKDGDFIAYAVYSDMEETADFVCSNPLINQLVKNSRWSQKGNFLDVPVDCPTRERNAWTGDAQVYVRTASTFMNAYLFYEKWLYDQSLEQYASGKVGITFPSTSSVHNPLEVEEMKKINPVYEIAGPTGNGNIGEDATGWGDSAVWLPYVIYLCYGDKNILKQQYETAKKWVDYELFCAKEHNSMYADKPQYHTYTDGELDAEYIFDTRFHYGEWNEAIGMGQKGTMSENIEDVDSVEGEKKFIIEKTQEEILVEKQAVAERVNRFIAYMAKIGNPIVATAYMARSTDNLSEMAKALGKTEDALKYAKISEKIRMMYDKYLIAEDGVIEEGHQAPYVRALVMNLCSKEKREKVLEQLIKEIKANDYKLNTGFLSTPFLLPVLCENGYTEIAYRILEQEKLPGWLYPILQGATTIPESWDGTDRLEDSLNHYSYGSVCEFLFSYVGGIKPIFEKPGYAEFEIKPKIGGSLTYAETSYESLYGTIISRWDRTGESTTFEFAIPVNTKAHITLPNGRKEILGSGTWRF